MKNFLTLLLLLLSISYLNAQDWVRQHPFTVFESLQAISLDDEGRGWAVGGNSTILRTDNWGVNWDVQQPINLGVSLLAIEIIPGSDGQEAFIGGNTLLKTIDGGENWQQIFGFTNPVYEIEALDDQNIFTFGLNDTSKKSTDGGDTWVEFPNPVASGKMIASFLDPLNGWASGGTYQDAQMYRTSDGGESWTLLDTTRHAVIMGIHMMDEQKGFMASTKRIHKTLDGGTTWTVISDQELPSLTDLYIVNEQEIWACMNNGGVYFTMDGGTNWDFVYPDVFSSNSTEGIHATTGGQAWVAGRYSSILYTADIGQSWQDLTPGNRNSLNKIQFFDDDHGFAAGVNGTLVKTVDGGAIWEDISLPSTDDGIVGLAMTSTETVYILNNEDGLLKSVNGGETWTLLGDHMVNNVYNMEVITDQHICVFSQFGDISTTFNGGATWSVSDLQTYNSKDASFSSANVGWMASSQGSVLKTTDGGIQWTPVTVAPEGDFKSIQFLDEMEGWVIGGTYGDSLFHTSNGGVDWEVQYIPYSTFWQELSFMDRDTGWVAGGSSGHSEIWKTTDGGATWARTYTDGAQLRSITSLSSNKAWASGVGGSIVHFSPCNALPQLSSLSGAQQLCEGDTVQYQVNSENVVVFNWELPTDWTIIGNSNTALIEVLVGSETGSIQLTGENSCETLSQPITLDVTVDNSTDIDLSVNTNTIEASSGGSTYSWYLNGELINESSSNIYVAEESGLYYVIVTFNSGCSTTSDVVNVMVTGINELEIQAQIKVYPNPTTGLVSINLPTEIADATVRFLDLNGKPLFEKDYDSQQKWDLSSYPAGIYYAAIISQEGIFYKKILLVEEQK